MSVRGRSLLGQLYGDSGYRFHGFLAVKRGLMDLRVAFYLYVNDMIIDDKAVGWTGLGGY